MGGRRGHSHLKSLLVLIPAKSIWGQRDVFVGTILPLNRESPKLFLEMSSRLTNPALPPKLGGSVMLHYNLTAGSRLPLYSRSADGKNTPFFKYPFSCTPCLIPPTFVSWLTNRPLDLELSQRAEM